ncbi:MAG: tetratricopeptide repeat protein [Planctomycetota bacterium]
MHAIQRLLVLLMLCVLATPAAAQRVEIELLDEGWVNAERPPIDADEAFLRGAYAMVLDGRHDRAKVVVTRWLNENRGLDNQWTPLALLIRGDAKLADDDEYEALYDYEEIANNYPGSPEYIKAAERELDIAVAYLEGKFRKLLGLRVLSARRDAEELLVRIAERLPGSQVAERALLELGAFYRRTGEFELAREVYGVFLQTFPTSPFYRVVLLARIEATFAEYNGPQYDGSGLLETRALLDEYEDRYPGDLAVEAELDALRVRIDENQGRQMLSSARVYLLRGERAAARYVLRRLVAAHPRTTAAREAIAILDERGWLREDVR